MAGISGNITLLLKQEVLDAVSLGGTEHRAALQIPPGHVGVGANLDMAQDVGELLWHQHSDLIHGTAELQVAQVEACGEGVAAPLVISQLVLGTKALLESAIPHSGAHAAAIAQPAQLEKGTAQEDNPVLPG